LCRNVNSRTLGHAYPGAVQLQAMTTSWFPEDNSLQSKSIINPCGPAILRGKLASPLATMEPSIRTTAVRVGPPYPGPEHHPLAWHVPFWLITNGSDEPCDPSPPHAGTGGGGGMGGSAQCDGLGSPSHGVHTPPCFNGLLLGSIPPFSCRRFNELNAL
jgi:hypothetical protein